MTREAHQPVLLLDRDGYSIETVIAGLTVAWILLAVDEYGKVRNVASGSRFSYDRARRDAYDAFIQHSADDRARRESQEARG